jgi:hypothetical protein
MTDTKRVTPPTPEALALVARWKAEQQACRRAPRWGRGRSKNSAPDAVRVAAGNSAGRVFISKEISR